MGDAKSHDIKQDQHSTSCRRSGKMAVLTLCGSCNQPVVGVIMRTPRLYCIECKTCGYSAISHFRDDAGRPRV